VAVWPRHSAQVHSIGLYTKAARATRSAWLPCGARVNPGGCGEIHLKMQISALVRISIADRPRKACVGSKLRTPHIARLPSPLCLAQCDPVFESVADRYNLVTGLSHSA